jgi:N-acetylglucosamine-6-phosphate deacetylase
MLVLTGADLVLPDRIQSAGTLVIDGGRIVDIGSASFAPYASAFAPSDIAALRRDRPIAPNAPTAPTAPIAPTAPNAPAAPNAPIAPAAPTAPISSVDLRGHTIVPGFIDVHVHGLEGIDTLDGHDAIATIAQRLPKYGVTAFCPTTVACVPQALREALDEVSTLLSDSSHLRARVLPAHLESNFINPQYKGAQPAACLRMPPARSGAMGLSRRSGEAAKADAFDGADIVDEIDRAGASVGIVTLAPELDGALDLIRHLAGNGRRVSLGHSGATLEEARAAIAAGARHATHLFNRMPPINHREPGLVGAILTSDEIAAEVICDGVHVHREMVRMAIATKGVKRMMAITDGVAAAGLSDGASASLGGRRIRVRSGAAYLEDGTLAGSIATMDGVFRFLVRDVGLSLPEAACLCATTPATELGLTNVAVIARGALANLVVLDGDLRVKQTYIAGDLAYSR